MPTAQRGTPVVELVYTRGQEEPGLSFSSRIAYFDNPLEWAAPILRFLLEGEDSYKDAYSQATLWEKVKQNEIGIFGAFVREADAGEEELKGIMAVELFTNDFGLVFNIIAVIGTDFYQWRNLLFEVDEIAKMLGANQIQAQVREGLRPLFQSAGYKTKYLATKELI